MKDGTESKPTLQDYKLQLTWTLAQQLISYHCHQIFCNTSSLASAVCLPLKPNNKTQRKS